MKKNTFKIVIIVSLVMVIIGIILMANYETPYEICKGIIEGYGEYDHYTYEDYKYGLDHIIGYATLYFSGIVLTILGSISFVVGQIWRNVSKKEKSISTEVKNFLD